VEAVRVQPGTVRFSVRQRTWTLRAPEDFSLSIGIGSYSPSYGVKHPCRVLDFAARVRLDGTNTWTFSITA
jgi:hypothetical protein